MRGRFEMDPGDAAVRLRSPSLAVLGVVRGHEAFVY